MSASEVAEVARRSKTAAAQLAMLPRSVKDAALSAMAEALDQSHAAILEANQSDVDRARSNGVADAVIDRLSLTPQRIGQMSAGLREVVALPDPIGEVVRGSTLPNGLELRQIRVPLGVVGMIYEARPNVTVDAAALCIKSGNAALLRGSSSALASNQALVSVIAVGELMLATKEVIATTFQPFPLYLAAAAIYWAMSAFFETLQKKLETRLNRSYLR